MKNPKAQPAGLHTFTFAIAAAPGSTDSGSRRFEGTAYSGGVVPSYGWAGDVAIDLATLQNPQGDELPVLIDHDTRIDAIAGRGRISVQADADGILSLTIEGETTGATAAGQRIRALLDAGYPLQMSVGMSASLREIASGTVEVNGRSLQVQAIFEQPHIREVSFVAVGADPATRAASMSATLSPTPASKEQQTMTRTAEDEALIAGLRQQVTDLSAQIDAIKTQQRTADLSALMADIGRDTPTGDAARPYLTMSDDAFTVLAADLRATATAARNAAAGDRSLFSAQSPARAEQRSNSQGKDPGLQLMAAIDRITNRKTH